MPVSEPSYVERCPKCGGASASPPAEVYCVECATEGWEQDAMAHLLHRAECAEAEVDALRKALDVALDALVKDPDAS